jgi:phenylacetate-CoA ligase
MTNLIRVVGYLAGSFRRLNFKKNDLIKYQEKKLRSVVKYAYDNVSYYHEKLKNENISPSSIKSLPDLNKLPVIKKEEFRNLPPEKILSSKYSFDIGKLRKVRTSGSTGTPLTIYLAPRESDWRKAIYMRANIVCGQKPLDKWVVITNPIHFGDTTKIQKIIGVYSQSCVSVFESIDNQLKVLEKIQPEILDGYSSAIYLLAKHAKENDRILKPKIIFGNAEIVTKKSIKKIEEVFQAPYYDQYGCAEFNRTAWQCREGEAYHMDVDSVLTQIVDEDNQEVSLGEKGAIIQTSLFNYAMPFIRYEVGDMGTISEDECNCGINLPLLSTIEGRRDDLIYLPNGGIISPRAFSVAVFNFKDYDYIDYFNIVQKKIDLIELKIKLKEGIDEKKFSDGLYNQLIQTIGLSRDIMNIEIIDEVEKTKTGKIGLVTSEIAR